jgi:hypothetical protein
MRIASMSCVDCSFTFLVFASSRSIEQVPETMKIDNTEGQCLSIDEQVKHGISEDPHWFVSDKGKP